MVQGERVRDVATEAERGKHDIADVAYDTLEQKYLLAREVLSRDPHPQGGSAEKRHSWVPQEDCTGADSRR